MGVLAYFILVTSPLWVLYIVITAGESSNRKTLLWACIVIVIGSWLLVEHLSRGAMFGMLRVFQTAPAVISLAIAGITLYTEKRGAKAQPKQDSDKTDAA